MKLDENLSKLEALILFCVEHRISAYNFIAGDEVDIFTPDAWSIYEGLIDKGYIHEEEQKIIKPYYEVEEEQKFENSPNLDVEFVNKLKSKFSVENIQVPNRMAKAAAIHLALRDFQKKYPSVSKEQIEGATDRMISIYKNAGNNESIPNVLKFIIGTTDTNSLYYWIDEYNIAQEATKKIDNRLL